FQVGPCQSGERSENHRTVVAVSAVGDRQQALSCRIAAPHRDGAWQAGKYATAWRQRRTAAVGAGRTDRCRPPRRTGRTQNRPAERQSLGGDGPTGSRGNGPTENQ